MEPILSRKALIRLQNAFAAGNEQRPSVAGSNPAPSSGESAANLTSSPWRRHAAFAFTCSCNHGRERGKETPHDIASDLRLTSVPSPGRETCARGR